MKDRLLRLSYILADMGICILSMFLAVYVKYDGAIPASYAGLFPTYFVIAVVSNLVFSMIIGSYSSMLMYAGVAEAFRQGFAALLSGCVFLVVKAADLLPVSGSITVMYAVFLFILTAVIRILPRLFGRLGIFKRQQAGEMKRVVIIGAGAAGAMLAKRLKDNAYDGLHPVAFVDDDPAKQGLLVAGVRVRGKIENIARVMRRTNADEIVIAVPSMSSEWLKDVYETCAELKYPIKLFRSVVDAAKYMAGDHSTLKDVSIEDLLFRDSVKTDMRPVFDFLSGKTVMVTGGAGSIGSEVCRQVLEHGCGKLIIFDIHENGMFELNEELKKLYDPARYVLCIGSVREQQRLQAVFDQYRPDMVVHAAAHKHVPMMEINPAEAVKNNVMGTRNVLNCCVEYGVKRFVLISTDKAVNPTNVMGATKRVAELLVQTMNGMGGCEMAAVRFGNVLGSNGSVIPLFKKQIAAGGPVTVTHQDMRRYFMTIPEAVSLVLSAGVLARGGELFVLDMGKPVRIYDLAQSLIRLSGYEPGKDIQIRITGLRPGEKMFEEIALDSESVDATAHNKIFIVRSQPISREVLNERLEALVALAVSQPRDDGMLRRELLGLVKDFSATQGVRPAEVAASAAP